MSSYRPLSLAQHFNAPDGYTGLFGWMCGFSADVEFLNNAVERFSGLTKGQRAHFGDIKLALMLDPGNAQITPVEVPGIAHLPMKALSIKPFTLLHAKIALLGFHNESDGWLLRLIVSTGNWTVQTLEESLDLAWCVDIHSDDLNYLTHETRLRCADVNAAVSMFDWLTPYFDLRILDPKVSGRSSASFLATSRIKEWIGKCKINARGKPRFFDNREQSLLKQLPGKIKNTSGAARRNYFAMGSGFFEAPSSTKRMPSVLQKIVGALQKNNLLTQQCELDVFVNPDACQSVSTALKALNGQGYKVRKAGIPTEFSPGNQARSLHAKFLFAANSQFNSNKASSAWVYLGSGNLTNPGFSLRAQQNLGNLEAGVVFPAGDLYWEDGKDISPDKVVTKLLPIQWDEELTDDTSLQSGSNDLPERNEIWIASPVSYLLWCQRTNDSGLLVIPEGEDDIVALNASGQECEMTSEGFFWQGSPPRMVDIRWKNINKIETGKIPVIDEFGRIASTELQPLELDEAWWQLANFPSAPDIDGSDQDDEEHSATANGSSSGGQAAAPYAIRQMMESIENIANRQAAIYKSDWPTWCLRLEQTLIQASKSSIVKSCRNLKINPLSPLFAEPFRPVYAESSGSMEGKIYEEALLRVAKKWEVDGLAPIGGDL